MHPLARSSRSRLRPVVALLGMAMTATLAVAPGADAAEKFLPRRIDTENGSGVARTITSARLRLDNPFFQSLGTNGRSCATCHDPGEGWTITAAGARRRFEASGGLEPLFRVIDGNSPLADVSTVAARRAAFSLLLSRGLIRITGSVPEGAEFVVDAVDDPHGYATPQALSLFRRPLPATNQRFITSIMWDGRENRVDLGLVDNLKRQASNAARRHAETGRDLTAQELDAIVGLTMSLHTGQWRDRDAGVLGNEPVGLSKEFFSPGINSSADFDPDVFTLFERWDRRSASRRALARGEALFNRRELGSPGFTCSVCHNAPNVGVHSRGGTFDLGISKDLARTPDLPVYTLRCLATGAVVQTTDPGRALTTGRCADIDHFKVPSLRGLAARPPYFHSGTAATLDEVLAVYERRFGFTFTDAERADLIAFLRAL
jgi:cytochrome c peroxidase